MGGVGRKGQVKVPAGAARVDLTGKTVIPAIVDTHTHLAGTREALVDQLQRLAYYGAAAALSLGQDAGDLPFQVRAETIPGAARFRTAGRGITMPEPGRTDIPYWITSEAEARKAVQELAARKVDLVKIWVDDRDGKYQKLTPALYGAIIDEAHKHTLRVAAHIFTLDDAKGLLRAGIDGFAHGVRDRDIDDELVTLFKQRPDVFLIPNLPDQGMAGSLAWLSDTVAPAELKKMQEAQAARKPGVPESFAIQARKAVQELAGRKVDLVKIWVDDRDGKYKKLTPALYGAIIDEAHKHDLRVTAHIFTLDDAKGLLRAGIDGFAHGVRDKDIDEELVALFKQRPNVFLVPNLPDRGMTGDLAWLSDTVAPAELQKMQETQAARKPGVPESFAVQARNLAKLNAAGVRIGMGTDGPSAGWNPHVEMADMVAAGMTPAHVIVAATRTSADILRLSDLGTVATGKSADFVVLEANPLDDITNTRRITQVYLRGTAVDRAALKARWTRRDDRPDERPGVNLHRNSLDSVRAPVGW
ncbi:MAG: amidohydrolase family protein [Acidobacteria bacterium]|nr:amidohydrolase family protein [Acidobacteriota bacterium]